MPANLSSSDSKVNENLSETPDRPLILGVSLGITLSPNHILLGFRNNHGGEVNPEVPGQHQLTKWNVGLSMFGSLWIQEYTRHCITIAWRKQDMVPKVGDIILFFNKPCYKHELSAARIQALLT